MASEYLAKLRAIDHNVIPWPLHAQARGPHYRGNRLYPGVVMLAKLPGEEPAAVMVV